MDEHSEQTPTAETNPYAVTTQLPATPLPTQRRAALGPRAFGTATALSALLLAGAPVSAYFADQDIESILASGSAMTIVALIQLAVARFRRPLLYSALPLLVLAFCVFVFAWIYFNQWSPRDAQDPVSRAIWWYAAVQSAGWLPLAWQARKVGGRRGVTAA